MPSGLRDTRQWFANQTNLQRSLKALQILTDEFTQSSYGNTVIAIELVNEPFPYNDAEFAFLQSYYTQGYYTVASANHQQQMVVALDDGFRGLQVWLGFMTEPQFHDVALDTVRCACGTVLTCSTSTRCEETCECPTDAQVQQRYPGDGVF